LFHFVENTGVDVGDDVGDIVGFLAWELLQDVCLISLKI
jgi:hypothetical protein